MFSPINIIIALLWLASALADFFEYTYIWQLKEYRMDRFRDFLTTVQGQKFLNRYQFFWRSFLSIIIFFWPINDIVVLKYLLITLFFVDFIILLYHKVKRGLIRPVFTHKAILIILVSLLSESLIFIYSQDWILLLLLLIIRFFTLSFWVWIVNQPTIWIKKYLIKKATKKINRLKNLTVIGITGSYGKSTVKKFLAHILSQKFSVIHTPGNINTEIGVAKFILTNDFSDKNIFIVEMGAYTIGEIKLLCNMVKPKVGILTAINEQHLSLFGSIKNTQKAKYELLESLPTDGLAITNGDNPYCTEFLYKLKSQIKTFGFEKENNPDLLVTDINTTPEKTSFSYTYLGKEYQIESNILGDHNALNLGACKIVADFFKMNNNEIKEAIKTLPRITEPIKYGNTTIIDDSYNSNPDGFKAALNFLTTFKNKRKIIVTRGMLELGKETDYLHEKIAGEISFVADELIIIRPDFADALKKGIVPKFGTKVRTIFNDQDLLNYFKKIKKEEAVILLENKIPTIVMNEINK